MTNRKCPPCNNLPGEVCTCTSDCKHPECLGGPDAAGWLNTPMACIYDCGYKGTFREVIQHQYDVHVIELVTLELHAVNENLRQ